MAAMSAEQKESTIREAILDLVAYFAVFGLPVHQDRLISLLSVRASHLAILTIAQQMVDDGKLIHIEDAYGLANVHYADIEQMRMHCEYLLRKAHRVGKLVGLIPFVKAVCVMNSVAIGHANEDSDIDLLIVTTPGRIFIANSVLTKLFSLIRIIETSEHRASRFSLNMLLTTRGVVFEKDIMQENEPDLVYRMMTVVPVYGERRWYEVLRASSYLKAAVPNYLWPTGNRTIDRSGWKLFDRLDDRGYRTHLKRTSRQKKNLQPEAFIRVRPDIINLQADDATKAIAAQWRKLRGRVERSTSKRNHLRPSSAIRRSQEKS